MVSHLPQRIGADSSGLGQFDPLSGALSWRGLLFRDSLRKSFHVRPSGDMTQGMFRRRKLFRMGQRWRGNISFAIFVVVINGSRMPGKKDYTKSAFSLTSIVTLILVCVAFIPSFRVGAVVVKRANILSDVITFQDERMVPVADMSMLDSSFLEDFKPVPVQEVVDATGVTEAQDSGYGGTDRGKDDFSIPRIDDPSIVQIKDYSPHGRMMASFYHALAYEAGVRPVRIAVLGDSFIEADIITADMREQLQMLYGGNGVGFVPFSTPLSKYRGTVTHTHEGWVNYNLIKRKSVPEEYREWFFVSGMLSIPKESAHTEYKGVRFRRRIEKANTVSLYFVNRKNTTLDLSLNGGEPRHYTPVPGTQVQCITIAEPDIAAVKVQLSDPDGFIGYGVVLEDSTGVSVHNFSVRSNSGLALLGTDYDINRQFDEYMAYDLIILQYGLNAMSADVTNYAHYEKQLVKIVNYVKQCFPGSAVVIMSVGDRSTMQNGTAVTMPAVKAMLRAQESAASECGVGFWNTYRAMGGDNSMPKFVERQWAAKDYTHIGYPGGRYIAGQFVDFIDAAVKSVKEQDAAKAEILPVRSLSEIVRERGFDRVIDSTANSKLRDNSAGKYSFGSCPYETGTADGGKVAEGLEAMPPEGMGTGRLLREASGQDRASADGSVATKVTGGTARQAQDGAALLEEAVDSTRGDVGVDERPSRKVLSVDAGNHAREGAGMDEGTPRDSMVIAGMKGSLEEVLPHGAASCPADAPLYVGSDVSHARSGRNDAGTPNRHSEGKEGGIPDANDVETVSEDRLTGGTMRSEL